VFCRRIAEREEAFLFRDKDTMGLQWSCDCFRGRSILSAALGIFASNNNSVTPWNKNFSNSVRLIPLSLSFGCIGHRPQNKKHTFLRIQQS